MSSSIVISKINLVSKKGTQTAEACETIGSEFMRQASQNKLFKEELSPVIQSLVYLQEVANHYLTAFKQLENHLPSRVQMQGRSLAMLTGVVHQASAPNRLIAPAPPASASPKRKQKSKAELLVEYESLIAEIDDDEDAEMENLANSVQYL